MEHGRRLFCIKSTPRPDHKAGARAGEMKPNYYTNNFIFSNRLEYVTSPGKMR